MEKNEKFERIFFGHCFQSIILWKTGGYLILGQNVCIFYTLSVGLLIRISRCQRHPETMKKESHGAAT